VPDKKFTGIIATMRVNGLERLPFSRITVKDNSLEAKEIFFGVLDAVVTYHSKRSSFNEICDFYLEGERTSLAFWMVDGIEETGSGISLHNTEIHVNMCDFVLGRKNYTEFVPLTVLHEKCELWNMAGKKMLAPINTPEYGVYGNMSHKKALLEEFREAIRIGVGERYLDFLISFAQMMPDSDAKVEFFRDNIRAFGLANSTT
jgi:hypothetical protein